MKIGIFWVNFVGTWIRITKPTSVQHSGPQKSSIPHKNPVINHNYVNRVRKVKQYIITNQQQIASRFKKNKREAYKQVIQ